MDASLALTASCGLQASLLSVQETLSMVNTGLHGASVGPCLPESGFSASR